VGDRPPPLQAMICQHGWYKRYPNESEVVAGIKTRWAAGYPGGSGSGNWLNICRRNLGLSARCGAVRGTTAARASVNWSQIGLLSGMRRANGGHGPTKAFNSYTATVGACTVLVKIVAQQCLTPRRCALPPQQTIPSCGTASMTGGTTAADCPATAGTPLVNGPTWVGGRLTTPWTSTAARSTPACPHRERSE
jgi:hypothetical protein